MKWLILFLVASVSGCAEVATTNVLPEPTLPEIPRSECLGNFQGEFVEFSHVEQHLPAGFTARDASEFYQLGPLVPPYDRALILAYGNTCITNGAHLGYLGFWIFIEPPEFDGIPLDGDHWYEVQGYYDNAPFHYPFHENITALAENVDLASRFLANNGALLYLQNYPTDEAVPMNDQFHIWAKPDDVFLELRGTMTGDLHFGVGQCASEDPFVNEFLNCEVVFAGVAGYFENLIVEAQFIEHRA